MITTQRLGALALTGLALASLACSPDQDTATDDTAAATSVVGSEAVTSETPEPAVPGTRAPVTAAPIATEPPVTRPAPSTSTEAPVTTPAPSTTTTTEAPVAPTIAPVPALMPNVVCMNLQDAQDLIQEQGVFLSLSQDATGHGRAQILDANWQVVNQFPETGTPIDEGDAMLDVVKYGEPSPCA